MLAAPHLQTSRSEQPKQIFVDCNNIGDRATSTTESCYICGNQSKKHKKNDEVVIERFPSIKLLQANGIDVGAHKVCLRTEKERLRRQSQAYAT